MDQTNEAGTDSNRPEQQRDHESPSNSPINDSWRPSDYYASPPKEARFPRWVPISCGVVAVFALVMMFGVGMFLRSGGMGSIVALAIGEFQGGIERMAADDVTEDARESLKSSLKKIREGLISGTIDQAKVLPLLEEIQRVSKDKKISAEEVEALNSVLEEIEPTEDATPQTGDF